MKAEILRRAVNDVHQRADERRHHSPSYTNVPSKVAGNLASQKKARLLAEKVQQNKSYDINMQ
jgi:hypothetical protein